MDLWVKEISLSAEKSRFKLCSLLRTSMSTSSFINIGLVKLVFEMV